MTTCRPAAAYFDVASLLGEEYFTKPPPRKGFRVTVGSTTDGNITTWDVDQHTAECIGRMVRARADLRCGVVAYDEQPA